MCRYGVMESLNWQDGQGCVFVRNGSLKKSELSQGLLFKGWKTIEAECCWFLPPISSETGSKGDTVFSVFLLTRALSSG